MGRPTWFASRAKFPALLVVAAVLLSLPALQVGLLNDDLLHRLMLEDQFPGYEHAWWRLYDFTPPAVPGPAQREAGYMPWFTHDDLSLRLFRPITSALLALDHVLFGRASLPAHLHSIGWLVAAALLTHACYRRWLSRPAALVASLVFATSATHAMSLAWLAARHTLVAATFAALALWAQTRYRAEGWRPGRWMMVLAALLSLGASEAGLGALVFLIGYELGAPLGRARRQRLLGAASFAGLGGAYLLVYAAAGYGANGSAAYVSPFSAPLEFLQIAFVRVPVLAGELFGAIPSLFASNARAEWVLAGVGSVFTALVFGVLSWRRGELTPAERRHLLWLGPATLLSALPTVGAIMGGRLLPLATVGGSAVVGSALVVLWKTWRRGAGGVRWGSGAALLPLGCLHLLLSPLLRLALPVELGRLARVQREIAEQAEVGDCGQRGYSYLLTGADPTLSLYAMAATLLFAPHKGRAGYFRVLSMAPHDQRLRRTGPRSFELETLGETRRSSAFERLYRPTTAPLQAGHEQALRELTVRVRQTHDGLFQRATFEVAHDLDRTCALVWRSGRLQTLPWPELGQSVIIAHELGPMHL